MSSVFTGLAKKKEKTLKEGELTFGELAKIYQEYLASILEGFLITEMAEPNSSESLLNSVIDSK